MHFILFTPLGAKLTSASAITGTDNSVLTVSGCQFGTPVTSNTILITISTAVLDAKTGGLWSGTETPGATSADSSILTPASPGTAPPSGTVTYTFFTNGSCQGQGAGDTVTLRANGTVPNSATSLPLAAGSYSYDAVYSGDSIYSASSVSPCEPFTVAMGTPTLTTVVDDAATHAPWSGTEVAGAAAFDTSTLTGTFVGFPATGSVTYTFFQNGNCTAPGHTEAVPITTAGVMPDSSNTVTLPAGNYSFEAVYSGDANDNQVTSPCEPFSVLANSGSPTTSGSTTSGGASSVTTAGSTLAPTLTPTLAPTAAPAAAPSTAPSTRTAAASGIAFTGADLAAMFAAGLLLLGTGAFLVLGARRRRSQPTS